MYLILTEALKQFSLSGKFLDEVLAVQGMILLINSESFETCPKFMLTNRSLDLSLLFLESLNSDIKSMVSDLSIPDGNYFMQISNEMNAAIDKINTYKEIIELKQ